MLPERAMFLSSVGLLNIFDSFRKSPRSGEELASHMDNLIGAEVGGYGREKTPLAVDLIG